MSSPFAAIVGGSAGGVVLLVIGILLLYFFGCKGFSNKTSETGSSDPSTLELLHHLGQQVVESNRPGQAPSGCSPSEHQEARRFSLKELEQATNCFGESNLVGVGSFGLVYKGLLLDGTVVAIKRRQRAPKEEFLEEVNKLSAIWHRHLVNLIGYCQEGGLQMLVFEYLPNRSISHHLYDTRNQAAKLEFKQRLSIAVGAAKGLSHLYSLTPPMGHLNFKTSNVLVDENFIAKVADAGIVKLLRRLDDTGPSQASATDIFQDPQVGQYGLPSETSDAYSFGVFLLELITGQEAAGLLSQSPSESLSKLVEAHLRSNTLIDKRLGGRYTCEGMKELIVLTLRCLSSPGRRPKMVHIARELERILETEMTLTIVMGDDTPIVTLGSQLFTS